MLNNQPVVMFHFGGKLFMNVRPMKWLFINTIGVVTSGLIKIAANYYGI
jgi:hypothetical protein